jgi:uncharacterized protein with NRDE domain
LLLSLFTLSFGIWTTTQTTVKKHVMKAALKKGVEAGTLVMVKSSYKVSAEAKKVPKKAKPTTAVAVKKTMVKKVS